MYTKFFRYFEDLCGLYNFSILIDCLDTITNIQTTLLDSTNKHLTKVLVAFCLLNQHLEVPLLVDFWCRDLLYNCFEKVSHSNLRFYSVAKISNRPSVLCSGVDHWVVELVICRFKITKQIKNFAFDF